MNYRQAVEKLRERLDVPLFAVEPWDADLQAALRDATAETLFPGRRIASPPAAAGGSASRRAGKRVSGVASRRAA